jgi:hypothetical protein
MAQEDRRFGALDNRFGFGVRLAKISFPKRSKLNNTVPCQSLIERES